MYIVCICTYTRILTYFQNEKLLGASILSYTYKKRVYVQYTYNILNHIRAYTSKYIQYTCIFFGNPFQITIFSPCTYIDVYAVYSRIKDRYTNFENIYVRGRYMHVYARICMYLHVYCSFHLWPSHQLPVSSYMYVYVRIWWYLYVYEVYVRIVLVYACISWNHT